MIPVDYKTIYSQRKESHVKVASGEIVKKCESRYTFRKPADRNAKLPLIVYLHPMGGGYSTEWYSTLPSSIPKDFAQDFYYLHPLANGNDIFHSDNLYFLITDICKKYPNIDTSRIYGVGYSMGARCLWNLAIEWPDLFAAIVPISGFTCYIAAPRIAHVPSWTFHGTEDDVVPFNEAVKMFDALTSAAKTPGIHRGSAIKGQGHGIYPDVLKDGRVLEWLFQQKKS
jgi:predicted peptidase